MSINIIENFQHENTFINKPDIDFNYIFMNRLVKYILNFLIIYIFISITIFNYPDLSINSFILLICLIASITFYILDLYFPACSY